MFLLNLAMGSSLKFPFANAKRNGAVMHSTRHCRAPDHVLIDIPEPNVTHTSPIRDSTGHVTTEPAVADTRDVASEGPDSECLQLRHSARDRCQFIGYQTLETAFSRTTSLHIQTDRPACRGIFSLV